MVGVVWGPIARLARQARPGGNRWWARGAARQGPFDAPEQQRPIFIEARVTSDYLLRVTWVAEEIGSWCTRDELRVGSFVKD